MAASAMLAPPSPTWYATCAAALAPDGRTAATATKSGVVWYETTDDGRLRATRCTRLAGVAAVAMLRAEDDGSDVMAAASASKVHIYAADRHAATLAAPATITAVAAHDARLAALDAEGNVTLFHIRTADDIATTTVAAPPAAVLAFADASHICFAGADNTVTVVDVRDNARVAQQAPRDAGGVCSIDATFQAPHALVVATGTTNGRVYVVRFARTTEALTTVATATATIPARSQAQGSRQTFVAVRFLRASDSLALLTSGAGGEILRWMLKDDDSLHLHSRSPNAHPRPVFTIHASTDGSRVLTTSQERTVAVWTPYAEDDTRAVRAIDRVHALGGYPYALASTRHGGTSYLLAACGDGCVRVWRRASDATYTLRHMVWKGIDERCTCAAWHPCSGDEPAFVFATSTGALGFVAVPLDDARTAAGEPLLAGAPLGACGTALAWRTDQPSLIALSANGSCLEWRVDATACAAAAANATAARKASGARTQGDLLSAPIRAKDAALPPLVPEGTPRTWVAAQWMPPSSDGDDDTAAAVLALGALEGAVAAIRSSDGGWEPVFCAQSAHARRVNCIAWAPDASVLASASDDATAKLWRSVDGSLLATLRAHTDGVQHVAWSDKATLATASGDATAVVWTVSADGEASPASVLRGHTARVLSACFDASDDRVLLTGAEDQSVRAWRWDAPEHREASTALALKANARAERKEKKAAAALQAEGEKAAETAPAPAPAADESCAYDRLRALVADPDAPPTTPVDGAFADAEEAPPSSGAIDAARATARSHFAFGNGDAAIDALVNAPLGALSAEFVSASFAFGGAALWERMCRLYAKQCASLGRPHEAATFFLAAGDPQGAVAALERAGRADAAADVAEARLLRGDPTRARAVEGAASKATGARAAARWAAQGDWLRCAAALGLDAPDAGAARAAVEAHVRLAPPLARRTYGRAALLSLRPAPSPAAPEFAALAAAVAACGLAAPP